jgi:hypothetical protein
MRNFLLSRNTKKIPPAPSRSFSQFRPHFYPVLPNRSTFPQGRIFSLTPSSIL